MSTRDNLDNATGGFHSDAWWRETWIMVSRGADLFWKRKGLPEPSTDYFREVGNRWQTEGRLRRKAKELEEQGEQQD